MHIAIKIAVALAPIVVLSSGSARAADADMSSAARSVDVRTEVPITAYTYGAGGTSAGNVGAYAYGTGVVGRGSSVGGGGATVWGSPVDRLTLVGDGQRDIFGKFAPSAAAIVRLLGDGKQGLTIGALGKFKVEGFGVGPNDEIESEIEGGLLLSYARRGLHLDLNAVTGFGTGDDGEVDAEGRMRIGHDIGPLLRVGLDGQARYRVRGTTPLVGNRTWDFAAGPQLFLGSSHFFGSLTAGPTTMNVASGVGVTGVVSVGGSIL